MNHSVLVVLWNLHWIGLWLCLNQMWRKQKLGCKKENTCEAEERENNVWKYFSLYSLFKRMYKPMWHDKMTCHFLSNFFCLLFTSTIVLCFSLSATAEFASVNEILVPGQSSVYDVSFNSPNEDETKGKKTLWSTIYFIYY